MRKEDVEIGGRYRAKVSRKLTVIRIVAPAAFGSGWVAVNEQTGRAVRVKSAARLRERVGDDDE